MNKLVLGPTCSGKSLYIRKAYPEIQMMLGTDFLHGDLLPFSVLHYNILHYESPANIGKYISIRDEPLFRKIIENIDKFDEIIILVSPLSELLERVSSRNEVELSRDGPPYNRLHWSSVISKTNFFLLYENLFDVLEEAGVKFRLLYSSASNGDAITKESDRVYNHCNLRGRYVEPPNQPEISQLIDDPAFHYQTVLCPRGIRTKQLGYSHLPKQRNSSLRHLFDADLRGSSILDIGCALGQFIFDAERLGAQRLTGIEPNEMRYNSAKKLGTLLKSSAVFVNNTFLSAELSNNFDHVLCLNVIHHVPDPEIFLLAALALADRTLTVEFPTFLDPKYMSHFKLSSEQSRALNTLPVIGASSVRSIDQQYVFSPVAIKQLILDRAPPVKDIHMMDSQIQGRTMFIIEK